MNYNLKLYILYIVCIGLVITISSGCGQSSVENPVASSDKPDELNTAAPEKPNVTVNASKSTVAPGETVKITATVSTIRGSRLIFNWINATGYGEFSNINQNSATWTAPKDLNEEEVRVEVIQLVVTVISRIISVKESGVKTDTDIVTVTKTIPITIVG